MTTALRVHALRRPLLLGATLAVALAGPIAGAQATQRIFQQAFNGQVSAVTPPDSQGRVVLGGTFSRAGAWGTGGGAAFSPGSSEPDITFPNVAGSVYAATADGAGGFYIGGYFSSVDGIARANVAHVNADGGVDPTWNPGTDGTVSTIAVAGNTVYLGGEFAQVAGQTRNSLAAVSTSGALTSWYQPTNRSVYALAVSGSTVYVGGSFTCIGGSAAFGVLTSQCAANSGTTRRRVAAIGTDGTLSATWNPNLNPAFNNFGSSVYGLDVSADGSTVYVGGSFSDVGAASRDGLATLDGVGVGGGTGAATAWHPTVDGSTYTLALNADGSILYTGGTFQNIDTGGGSVTRNYAASYATGTGQVTGWDPDIGDYVNSVAPSGGTVYLGGYFTTANGGTPRFGAVAVDATTGAANSWAPRPDAPPGYNYPYVRLVAVSGGTVYVGGQFTCIGGATRNGLAQLDERNQLTAWDPNADSDVNALALSPDGTVVYAGGAFGTVNGVTTRNRLAAFDTTTGTATSWDPNAWNTVWSLALSDDGATVYAGGIFTAVNGGTVRSRLAAFDAATGTVTGWNPNMSNTVNAIAVVSGTVYAGGQFTTVNGGTTRNRLAALDAGTGTATGWNPNVGTGTVNAITVASGTVYAGGSFTTVNGGTTRNRLAAFDAASGSATSWDPNANSQVRALSLSPDAATLYAGGAFTAVNGATSRNYLAALNTGNGSATSWDPNIAGNSSPNVYALATGRGVVFTGGAFTRSGGQQTWNFSPLSATSGNPVSGWGLVPATPVGVTAVAGNAEATVSWTASSGATAYTATASPGGATCTSTGTSCIVTGLTNGSAYTFTVTASNDFGASAASAASPAVTPVGAGPNPTPNTPDAPITKADAVSVPAGVLRSGLNATPNGTVLLPLVCPQVPGGCDADGTLSALLPRSLPMAMTTRGRIAKVLAKFSGVRIAAGHTQLITLRLDSVTYQALRARGISRIKAILYTRNQLSGGQAVILRKYLWLHIAPMQRKPAVTG